VEQGSPLVLCAALGFRQARHLRRFTIRGFLGEPGLLRQAKGLALSAGGVLLRLRDPRGLFLLSLESLRLAPFLETRLGDFADTPSHEGADQRLPPSHRRPRTRSAGMAASAHFIWMSTTTTCGSSGGGDWGSSDMAVPPSRWLGTVTEIRGLGAETRNSVTVPALPR
jgi:hypothetical protein